MNIYLMVAELVVYPLVTLVIAWISYRFARRRGKRASFAWLTAVTVVAILLAPEWWTSVFNPLPKDEKIIANFQAHRGEFETLIRQYRDYEPKENEQHATHWGASLQTKKLMRDAGVDRLMYLGIGPLWLPDPYSSDALRSARELKARALREKDPFRVSIRYSPVTFELAPRQSYQWVFVWRYGLIWKQLLHFPEAPKIEQGELIYPSDVTGYRDKRLRVFKSLNHYPLHWHRGECVLRRLEEKWFICMCVGVT